MNYIIWNSVSALQKCTFSKCTNRIYRKVRLSSVCLKRKQNNSGQESSEKDQDQFQTFRYLSMLVSEVTFSITIGNLSNKWQCSLEMKMDRKGCRFKTLFMDFPTKNIKSLIFSGSEIFWFEMASRHPESSYLFS
jgi:hypothetical protein